MNEMPDMTELKKRHGCLTAWLVFMLIANAIVALVYVFKGDAVSANTPGGISMPLLMALRVMAILNTLFAVLLLRWKRIGFWGFLVSTVVIFVVNLQIGHGVLVALPGLLGITILFALLQMKTVSGSGWDNLK